MDDNSLYRVEILDSTLSDYCTSFCDNSVFIDTNVLNNKIYLCRISFDGHGCCKLENQDAADLKISDSINLIDEFREDNFDQLTVYSLNRRLISINSKFIWPEALKEYNLV